ncbi:MAG: hypothetical protein ACRD96_02840 [Bryobacteraceae bacterium]
MTTRRAFCAALVPLAACRLSRQAALNRAVRYLWSRQAADGGWHSDTYGLLRSGQSLTPFVLDALMRLPAAPSEKISRALGFILRHTDQEGALGRIDPLLADYPNYATALAARCIQRPHPGLDYLRAQQFTEDNGWKPDDPCYGAWGMGGDRRTPPYPGHVDLSMTRHVLEALAFHFMPEDPVFARARIFLDRCQNPDGGFFFSTVVLDANKAGEQRSYGTATADGVLALRALRRAADPVRLGRAEAWLRAHHQPGGVPGFSGDAYKRWPQGLRYYYAAAAPWLNHDLEALQRPDGSFSNPEPLVKEDDPLIATAFAVRAFA